jgi:H+-transporting ATPase
MAVYGLHIITPIGWGWAGFVWGYALTCALLTDPVKLLAYRILDPTATKDPSSARKPLVRKPKVAAAV